MSSATPDQPLICFCQLVTARLIWGSLKKDSLSHACFAVDVDAAKTPFGAIITVELSSVQCLKLPGRATLTVHTPVKDGGILSCTVQTCPCFDEKDLEVTLDGCKA